MSLALRLLLLFSLLHLLVIVTPARSKSAAGPVSTASQQAPSLQEEDPENFEIEFLVPVVACFPVFQPALPVALDPPALQSFKPEGERPRPRV